MRTDDFPAKFADLVRLILESSRLGFQLINNKKPDLVFLDINLPNGSGFGFPT